MKMWTAEEEGSGQKICEKGREKETDEETPTRTDLLLSQPAVRYRIRYLLFLVVHSLVYVCFYGFASPLLFAYFSL